MSQACGTPKCERTARALCDCCKQNLCLQHLCEHNAALVSQLNPLTDEINAIGDRLNQLHLHETTRDCREQLERWCQDCHEKIDRFFKEKCQELDRLVAAKLDKQRQDILHIKTNMSKFIDAQEVTRQNIETLTSAIYHLKNEMNEVEQARFLVNACPLLIDDCTIQFQKVRECPFDLSNLSPSYRTLKYTPHSWHILASNDRLLLVHQKPNVCFLDTDSRIVKQVLWPYERISDVCWSSTLARFIILSTDGIILIDENTMSIEKASIMEKQDWFSCTCFNDQMFLSTNSWGSSIVETKLSSSIAVIREWKCPKTCTVDEIIDDMVYSNENLALLIRNRVKKSMRIELRSSKTLNHLWFQPLDGVHDTGIAYSCCSIGYDGWLVTDINAERLLHITTDGKMKRIVPYKTVPYNVTQFGSNMLVISTKSHINFHKI